MSEESHPYAQAKYIANQTVEKFIAEHPNPGFEITSVSPVGVMGKALSNREDSTSMGVQYLFKNKIAPNPFIQMFYDHDIYWAMVDVTDVADGIFKVATTSGLHGKNYIFSSESYRVSDITRMLNMEPSVHGPVIVYRNDLAQKELEMEFKPAQTPLHHFAAG